jgi:hypothetical protein
MKVVVSVKRPKLYLLHVTTLSSPRPYHFSSLKANTSYFTDIPATLKANDRGHASR